LTLLVILLSSFKLALLVLLPSASFLLVFLVPLSWCRYLVQCPKHPIHHFEDLN